MYKILIKNKRIKDSYSIYQIEQTSINDNSEVVTEKIDYETDSLEELTKTFTELLEKYPAEVLTPIESLKNEISVEITDETVESI